MFAALKKSIWPDPPAWTEPKERPVAAMVSGRIFPAAKASRPVTPDGTEAREALAANAKKRASVVAKIATLESKIGEIADAGQVDACLTPDDAISPEMLARALANPASFDLSQVQNRFADRLAEAANARAIGAPVIAGLAAQARELHAEHRRLSEEARHLADAIILAEGARLADEARRASDAALDAVAAIDGLISSARASGNGALVSGLMGQRRALPDERTARRMRDADIIGRFRRWASLRLPNDSAAVEDLQ